MESVQSINMAYCLNTEASQLDDLTAEISNYLRPKIGGDRFVLGAIHVAGGSSPESMETIANNLLFSAILQGPEQAVNQFIERTGEQETPYQAHTLISGVTVANRTQVAKGMWLSPAQGKYRALIPFGMRWHYPEYPGNTLGKSSIITSEETLKPAFQKLSNDEPDALDYNSLSVPDGKLPGDDIATLLSLVLDRPVVGINSWSTISILEPYGPHTGSGWGSYLDRIPTHEPSQANHSDIANVANLYAILSSSPDLLNKVRVPAEYWVKSKSALNGIDAVLYLGIALEALFLDGAREELSFRLGIRAARLLGADLQERSHIRDTLQNVYRNRSEAIHTGVIKKHSGDVTQIGQGLVRSAIIKIIKSRAYPDWKALEIA